MEYNYSTKEKIAILSQWKNIQINIELYWTLTAEIKKYYKFTTICLEKKEAHKIFKLFKEQITNISISSYNLMHKSNYNLIRDIIRLYKNNLYIVVEHDDNIPALVKLLMEVRVLQSLTINFLSNIYPSHITTCKNFPIETMDYIMLKFAKNEIRQLVIQTTENISEYFARYDEWGISVIQKDKLWHFHMRNN